MMPDTILIQDVISRLAAKVNCGDDAAGSFIKEFAVVVTQGLVADGIVRIDGLGTFKVISDVDGNQTVDFAPQPSLSEFVNEPFSMFESVELADSITDEELVSSDSLDDVNIDCHEESHDKAEVEPPLCPESTASCPESTAICPESTPKAEIPVKAEAAPREELKEHEESVTESRILPPPLPSRFKRDAVTPVDVMAVSAAKECPADDDGKTESVDDNKENREIENRRIDRHGKETVAERTPRDEAPLRPSYDSPVPVRLEPESRVTIKRVGHTTLTLVVTAIAACLLGLVIGYLAYRYVNFGMPGNVEILEDGILIRHDGRHLPDSVAGIVAAPVNVEEDSVGEKSMSAEESAVEGGDSAGNRLPAETTVGETTASAPKVVTDTVRPGNYLSLMARRHYGNAKFWVYIYIENKDKIKNPDNLEDGMVLVIPPREKYGIDPADKESLKKADRESYKAMSE